MAYGGHKSEWNRDKGSVPGHATKHPKMHSHSQPHTHFEARGFHEDKGGTTPERMRTGMQNKNKHIPEIPHQINVSGGHDPRPAHFHKNSGTNSDGHALIRRGGSAYRGRRD